MSDWNLADEYEENKDALETGALPEDEYTVTVKSARAATTQAGKHCFKVVLEVVGGPLAGRTVPDQLTWSPESEVAMRIFKQGLDAMGATQQWVMAAQPSPDQIAERIKGATVLVYLKEDEWQGQKRNRVTYKQAVSGTSASEQVTSLDTDEDDWMAG